MKIGTVALESRQKGNYCFLTKTAQPHGIVLFLSESKQLTFR